MVKWTKKKAATAKADISTGEAAAKRSLEWCAERSPRPTGRAVAPSTAEKAKKVKKEAK